MNDNERKLGIPGHAKESNKNITEPIRLPPTLPFLSKKPTPELLAAWKIDPKIFEPPKDRRICNYVPVNMCAEILFYLHLDEIQTFCQRHGVDLNPSVINKIQPSELILKNIPAYLYSQEDDSWSMPISDGLPNILIKSVFGQKNGLVTSGPYAGILLRTHREYPPQQAAMRVLRVMNDDPIGALKLPYIPKNDNIFDMDELEESITDEAKRHQLATKLAHAICGYISYLYISYALEEFGIDSTHMDVKSIRTLIASPETLHKIRISRLLQRITDDAGINIRFDNLVMTAPPLLSGRLRKNIGKAVLIPSLKNLAI